MGVRTQPLHQHHTPIQSTDTACSSCVASSGGDRKTAAVEVLYNTSSFLQVVRFNPADATIYPSLCRCWRQMGRNRTQAFHLQFTSSSMIEKIELSVSEASLIRKRYKHACLCFQLQ